MDTFDNIILGFQTALTFSNLFYCGLGALLGTLIGVLPGIGAPATIAMLLPITFTMEPTSALIMLAGIYYGAQYGGSTTAILVNMPGESASAVTAIDGYQMARAGRAGPALAIAAIGSFAAGTVGTLVIAVLAPPLTELALEFGPADYFSLIVLGLISSVALARDSIVNALAMVILGLVLGTVGTDVYTGTERFTFDVLGLADGLSFVAIAVGLFGVSEMIRNFENEKGRPLIVGAVSGLMPTRSELIASVPAIGRGTLMGSFLGVLPGGGATISSFAAYSMEKKLSKTPERFGKGAIEGVASAESANNAGAQTSFIPMLTLGIPSNPVMALMIGAMMIQGIVPGPNIASERPALFWGLIASMWVGNCMLLVLNLPLVGVWVRLISVPYYMLFPAIVIFSVIGVFTVNNSLFDLYTLAAFGLLGYVLVKCDCEPAPFVLGFVLGPMFEEQLRRALILSQGDPLTFVERPISATLLAVGAILLVLAALPAFTRRRKEVFSAD